MAEEPLIRITNLSKRFGTIQALDGASFSAVAGEVHVVLGENGAGKTSMMCVLAGLYQPDQGEIRIAGQPVTIRSPGDALRLGIAMVPQHAELVGNMTVWENVVLGHEGGGWRLDRRRSRERVSELAVRHRIDVHPDARVKELSAGQQQKVEILKALYRQARVLILDEPTTFLTPQETDNLFATLRHLKSRGLTILLITHKLRDALRIGDRLTVMRSGRTVATVSAAEATEEKLVQWMMGADPETSRRWMDAPPLHRVDPSAPVLLEVQGVSTGGDHHRISLQDVHLKVRAGEIHGIAGVTGSGQRELALALLGLLPVVKGRVFLRGSEITRWPVERRLAAGMALIPEDRIEDGILPAVSLAENLVLGLHRHLFPGIRYRPSQAQALATEVIQQYEVKAPHARIPVAYLSGGNMQKVIVARAVHASKHHPQPLVVAVNPTRGLDVRTVRHVRNRLRTVAAAGGAVVLMSEDLDELMEECHRISVIFQGRLVAQFSGPEYDRYRIGEAMLGRLAQEAAAA